MKANTRTVNTMKVNTPRTGTRLLLTGATMLLSCLLLGAVQPSHAQTTGSFTDKNILNPTSDGNQVYTEYYQPGSTGDVTLTVTSNAGQYSGKWGGGTSYPNRPFKGDFTMGRGWYGDDPNAPTQTAGTVNANDINTVGFNTGSYSESGQGCVSIYGFENAGNNAPKIEFYIVENWGKGGPVGVNLATGNGYVGYHYFNEGGTSVLYNTYREISSSKQLQYYDIRQGGQAQLGVNHTVSVSDHFANWTNNLKLPFGPSRQYMYLSTESFASGTTTNSGSVGASVWGY